MLNETSRVREHLYSRMEERKRNGNAYGLHIETNMFMPVGFASANADENFPHVKIRMMQDEPFLHESYEQYGSCEVGNFEYKCRQGEEFLIETEHAGAVAVNREGVYYLIPDRMRDNFENAVRCSYMLGFGIGLAMLLRLHGYIVLHACALRVGEKNILIMGDSGQGKSTLGSYLIRERGAVLIADDMSCIKDGILYAGMGEMKLSPEVLGQMFGKTSEKYWRMGIKEKYYYPIENAGSGAQGKIDKIVYLNSTGDEKTLSVKRLDREKLINQVVRNIFHPESLIPSQLDKEKSSIIEMFRDSEIEGYEVRTPKRLELLSQIVDKIV